MKRIVQKRFEEKLNYLLKQNMRCNGELITLTIHVIILTFFFLHLKIFLFFFNNIIQKQIQKRNN